MRERQYYPYGEWCTYHFPGWLIEDCNLDRSLSCFDYSRPSTTRKTRWVHGLLGAPTTPSAATALPCGPQQSLYHLYSRRNTWVVLRQRLTDTYRFIRLPRSLYFICQDTQRTRKLQKTPFFFPDVRLESTCDYWIGLFKGLTPNEGPRALCTELKMPASKWMVE